MKVKPVSVEHFELVASWLKEPGINQWLTSEWRNRDVTSGTIAMVVRNRRNRIYLIHEGQTPCGLVGLSDIDPVDQVAMIWYLLGDDNHSGKGLVTEAVKTVTQLAFIEFQFSNIYAWIMENNHASRRVLEKSGFVEVGRLRLATNSVGKQVDRVYFDLTKDDLPSG